MATRTGKRSLTALGAAVLIMTIATGCASSDDASGGSAGSGKNDVATAKANTAKLLKNPTTIDSAELGSFTPKPGGTLWAITCPQSNSACSGIAGEFTKAAQAIGYDSKICDAFTTPDAASTCFTQAINAKATAIVTVALGTNVANDGYSAAKAKGIPVVAAFSGNVTDGSVSSAEVAFNHCKDQGAAQADAIIADKGADADTVYLHETTFGCTKDRFAGFNGEYKKVCPACKLKVVDFTDSDASSTVPGLVQSALSQNPSLNYIAVPSDDPAGATVVDQITQAGRQDSVSVIGSDASQAALGLIKKGYVQKYDVGTPIGESAWSAVDAAARIIAGQKVPVEIRTPIVLIGKDNYDGLGLTDLGWMGTTGYADQFKKLWGVS